MRWTETGTPCHETSANNGEWTCATVITFSVWLAGGGIKWGTTYGATDDLGYHAVENVATVYDLWGTVLHLLGVDHEALTYRFGGRDFRLTDVHGQVISSILA